MNADLEDSIEVDDLPNFRLGGTMQFDVDASGTGAAAEVYTAETVELPEVIRLFAVYFQKQLREGNVYEVHAIYESTFNKLTDRFYKSSPWPNAETIAPLVGGDATFLLLYKELYFRHIYSKLQPTMEQRVASWQNYCDIFDTLLNTETPLALQLPNQWLWDMIDEFIYQFQTFCQFRQRVKFKTEEELNALKAHPAVFTAQGVLSYLHALHDKAQTPALKGAPLHAMAGYFAKVGLLRMHCLLADYRLALKTMDGVDLSSKGLFTKVTSCHISVFYYVGFAYLMSRRYVDATHVLSQILFYIGRTKQYHTRSYMFEQILKKNEQMYGMLAIAVSLCPQAQIDETIASTLRDRYGDRMLRMQSNNVDLASYEELFSFSCPKFVSPSPPPYNSLPESYNHQEAYRLQLRLFLREVSAQQQLPTIRSFLKLYSTISVPKLAQIVGEEDSTSPSAIREALQCLKHKTHGLTHTAGSPLSGCHASTADVDFFVADDVAHVADTALTKRHSDYFIRQITKLDDIIANIKAPAAA